MELNGETSGRRNFSLALVLAKVKLGMYLQVVNVCDIPWLFLLNFILPHFDQMTHLKKKKGDGDYMGDGTIWEE